MNVTSVPAVLILVAAALAGAARAQGSPDEALLRLQAGNRRFQAGESVPQPLGEGARRTLARGQSPFAIVVCCADSRVPPEHVFNTGLGELFVVRLAGHVLDAEALASVEYAAGHLGTQLCVVLGHEGCGAVAACCAQQQAAAAGKTTAADSEAIASLLQQIEPAVRRAMANDRGGKELADLAEAEHAQGTAVDVLRRSTLLQQLARAGRFQVLPARYRLASGEVEWLPPRPLPPAAAAAPAQHASPPNVAPHTALQLLQAGHRRFLGAGRPLGDVGAERRRALVEAQRPLAIVLACSDSRVVPEHVFDAGLGELFVVRVAGNVLNDDVLASVEYAAAHTGAPLLLVLGHTGCGAVAAAVEHDGSHPQPTPHLQALVQRLEPAVERARREGRSARDLGVLTVRANVLRVLQQARQQSRILRELEAAGTFALLPAVYDLASGDLEWLRDAGAAADVAPRAGAGDVPDAAGGATAAPAAPGGETQAGHPAAVTRPLPPTAAAQVTPMAHDPHGAPTPPATAAQGSTDLSWADGGPGPAAAHHGATLDEGPGVGSTPREPAAPGIDPKLVLGLAGIVSLSLAALLSLRARG